MNILRGKVVIIKIKGGIQENEKEILFCNFILGISYIFIRLYRLFSAKAMVSGLSIPAKNPFSRLSAIARFTAG